ncbi:MAG: malate dehydrogenase [Nitrospinota bacterium]
MGRNKITVVGAGNVGATVAQLLVYKKLGDVCLIDVMEGVAKGKALDLTEASPLDNYDAEIVGSSSYEASANSDIVVITAGLARKPGMTREDLLQKNAAIIKDVSSNIIKHSPNCFVIVVTNPLDTMSFVAKEETNLAKDRIVGMAGVLDSTRFRSFIAMELGVCMDDVVATVLGLHGEDMVPMPRFSSVAGIPITELLSSEKIDAIVERTKHGGAEIVKLLQTGSAFYAPAASVVNMVESILLDRKRVTPAAVYLEGEYGLNGLFMGVPIVLGKKGVEKVLELELTADEKVALQQSAESVKKSMKLL